MRGCTPSPSRNTPSTKFQHNPNIYTQLTLHMHTYFAYIKRLLNAGVQPPFPSRNTPPQSSSIPPNIYTQPTLHMHTYFAYIKRLLLTSWLIFFPNTTPIFSILKSNKFFQIRPPYLLTFIRNWNISFHH